jgi:hypothetical protein
MDDTITNAIDAVFAEYENTAELCEFKDEICLYVTEHIKELLKNGVNEKEAISRALEKLGDVTEAANLVSRKKRNEVIMQAYMRKVPIGIKHAIGYALSALILLAGLMSAGSVWFGGDRPIAVTSSLLPFVLISVSGFVFFGLTQETKKRYPLSWKRSLFYVVSAILLIAGIFVCITSLWEEPFVFRFDYEAHGYESPVLRDAKLADMLAGGVLPFIVPGLALFIFLIVTENDRRKEWVFKQDMNLATQNKTFASYSAALWFLALGIFFVIGFAVNWPISLVTFIFAGAGQCLIYGISIRKSALGNQLSWK